MSNGVGCQLKVKQRNRGNHSSFVEFGSWIANDKRMKLMNFGVLEVVFTRMQK